MSAIDSEKLVSKIIVEYTMNKKNKEEGLAELEEHIRDLEDMIRAVTREKKELEECLDKAKRAYYSIKENMNS